MAESLFGLLLVAFVACAAILPAIWMYQDAERRGANGAIWVVAWFVGNVAALVVWWFVRPRDPRFD